MIIFSAKGQLGNQIFQYMFLKSIQKNNETLIVSGFEDLKEVFEISDITNLDKTKAITRILFSLIKRIFKVLSAMRVINSIQVIHDIALDKRSRESTDYSCTKGLINSMTLVKPGYFQSESFFDKKSVKELKIKEKYITLAKLFLKQCPENSNKVFVHVRRGDYINWQVLEKSTLLPTSYFKKQIDYFINKKQNCFFFFLSDDPEFVENEFSFIKNKLISHNAHFGTDLAIMTMCQNAILSPSSFSWWGSYLMENRDTVFAPKYWIGFNSGVEYHSNPLPDFVKKIKV